MARNQVPPMDPASLYREELYLDRRVGSIRRLIPVTVEGAPDPARAEVFSGSITVMTPMGALPISFEIAAKTLAEAVAGFAAAAEKKIEETMDELRRLELEQSSLLAQSALSGTDCAVAAPVGRAAWAVWAAEGSSFPDARRVPSPSRRPRRSASSSWRSSSSARRERFCSATPCRGSWSDCASPMSARSCRCSGCGRTPASSSFSPVKAAVTANSTSRPAANGRSTLFPPIANPHQRRNLPLLASAGTVRRAA